MIKAGLDDVQVGIRGSAVTGISSKGGFFKWIESPSDVDFFIVSKKLENMLGAKGFKGNIGNIRELRKLNPEVGKIMKNFGDATTERLGRGANVIPIRKSLFDTLKSDEYILR